MEAKTRRGLSEANVYHVFSRGVGKQIIFECDKDRNTFLKLMRNSLAKKDVAIYAWCLMDNHFHLLLRGEPAEVAGFMQGLLSGYARYYNMEYDRSGHVFQDRYGSEPIDSEEYFLQAVRYIHRNPEKAGLAPTERYRWSSYREYTDVPRMATTAPLLKQFGSIAEFRRFHHLESDFKLCEYDDTSGDIAAKRALQIAILELGERELRNTRSLPRRERDSNLVRLSNRGLTQRQIERFTGVSRSVIARAISATSKNGPLDAKGD